ncbi:hypothetical protein KY306_00100 [Candidatus Woesearchaeota archaeon]|nr:hypothetical protein [Candidatus Woesearchaeota archaeon]
MKKIFLIWGVLVLLVIPICFGVSFNEAVWIDENTLKFYQDSTKWPTVPQDDFYAEAVKEEVLYYYNKENTNLWNLFLKEEGISGQWGWYESCVPENHGLCNRGICAAGLTCNEKRCIACEGNPSFVDSDNCQHWNVPKQEMTRKCCCYADNKLCGDELAGWNGCLAPGASWSAWGDCSDYTTTYTDCGGLSCGPVLEEMGFAHETGTDCENTPYPVYTYDQYYKYGLSESDLNSVLSHTSCWIQGEKARYSGDEFEKIYKVYGTPVMSNSLKCLINYDKWSENVKDDYDRVADRIGPEAEVWFDFTQSYDEDYYVVMDFINEYVNQFYSNDYAIDQDSAAFVYDQSKKEMVYLGREMVASTLKDLTLKVIDKNNNPLSEVSIYTSYTEYHSTDTCEDGNLPYTIASRDFNYLNFIAGQVNDFAASEAMGQLIGTEASNAIGVIPWFLIIPTFQAWCECTFGYPTSRQIGTTNNNGILIIERLAPKSWVTKDFYCVHLKAPPPATKVYKVCAYVSTDQDSATIKVNYNPEYIISNVENLGILAIDNKISFNEGDNAFIEVEGDNIDFVNVSIEKKSEDFGSLLVKGLDLGDGTKTVYVDKVSTGSKICILDIEINSIDEMTSDCSGENEILIDCPGSSGDYSCEIVDGRFKISGLKHSGVKEILYCGDRSCNNGESCSSCSSDCGKCNNGGGGSGSGGGGGSSTKKTIPVPVVKEEVCVSTDWNCGAWKGLCDNGFRTRECEDNCGNKKTEKLACSYEEKEETVEVESVSEDVGVGKAAGLFDRVKSNWYVLSLVMGVLIVLSLIGWRRRLF